MLIRSSSHTVSACIVHSIPGSKILVENNLFSPILRNGGPFGADTLRQPNFAQFHRLPARKLHGVVAQVEMQNLNVQKNCITGGFTVEADSTKKKE